MTITHTTTQQNILDILADQGACTLEYLGHRIYRYFGARELVAIMDELQALTEAGRIGYSPDGERLFSIPGPLA